MTRTYDKLVRDDVPESIEANGERPVVHSADDEEYERRLREKLCEEAAEFREDGDLDELADVLEVVHAVIENEGCSLEDLQRRQREKRAEYGGFEDRIVLERVEDHDPPD